MESPGPEKEMGVIRTGSIPHKSSESLKARLQAEKEKSDVRLSSKPDLKKSPKPDIPKKVKVIQFSSKLCALFPTAPTELAFDFFSLRL